MPVPASINDLSTTPAANSPDGTSEGPSTLDNYQRAHASFIAQLRDSRDAQIVEVQPIARGGTASTTAAAALSALGAPAAIQNQTYNAGQTAGTATAYTLTPAIALASNGAFRRFNVQFHAANTGTTPTLAISGLAAKALKVYDSAGVKQNPAIGALAISMLSDVVDDGTDFVVLTKPGDPLNTVRADVASASTIVLTNGTSNINITGTTTINGFTVAAGRLLFVRFNAALTLTNSAGLVTQSGANLTTAAGDTCMLRATAANTVEVLAYTRAMVQAIGDGQAWQVLTGSRSLNTVYTNTTGRPIVVSALMTINAANRVATGLIGGVVVAWGSGTGGTGYLSSVSFIVPDGLSYSVSSDSGTPTFINWSELR
jgi:hypothetical protein